jgi:hypothetical protein
LLGDSLLFSENWWVWVFKRGFKNRCGSFKKNHFEETRVEFQNFWKKTISAGFQRVVFTYRLTKSSIIFNLKFFILKVQKM